MFDDVAVGHRAAVSVDGSGARRVALVAHDALKDDMTAWAVEHAAVLASCEIVATGTTGMRVAQACPQLNVRRLKSGPFGGDQQIGAMIAEGELDALIFFVDGLSSLPHEADVRALMRLTLVYDVACAFNQRSADLLVRSGFLDEIPPRREAETPQRPELSLVA